MNKVYIVDWTSAEFDGTLNQNYKATSKRKVFSSRALAVNYESQLKSASIFLRTHISTHVQEVPLDSMEQL
jgi:hypothetical protein